MLSRLLLGGICVFVNPYLLTFFAPIDANQNKGSMLWRTHREALTCAKLKAPCPPVRSILLANVESKENKLHNFRARVCFQCDRRNYNLILQLMESYCIFPLGTRGRSQIQTRSKIQTRRFVLWPKLTKTGTPENQMPPHLPASRVYLSHHHSRLLPIPCRHAHCFTCNSWHI